MFRLASSVLAATAIVMIAGYSPTTFSAKPDRCEPWPSCRKDANDGSGDEGGGGGVPPVEILGLDAIANAITLRWDTPVPGPGESEVDHYEVWYRATMPLDGIDPDEISEVATLAERSHETPAYAPGTAEYFTIRNLEVGQTYYIAVRAVEANGSVSKMTFAQATTQRTAPGDWSVATVAEVGNETTCCRTTSAQFDADGNPTVAWMNQATMERPGAIHFASRGTEPDSWSVETVFVGGDCQACWMREIHGFRHQPSGNAEEYVPGAPAILFSHQAQLRGRHTAESVVFALRQGADDWVAEEVVRGRPRESGGIDGYYARFSMDFFYRPPEEDGEGSWIPTAAYVTTPEWESPLTTYALVLAERQADLSQPGTWLKTTLFECPILGPDSPILDSVRLRRDRDGLLHAMVRMRNDYHQWALFMHPGPDGTWIYRRSDGFNAFAFDVDGSGRYYIAGALGGSETISNTDLILVEDPALSDTSDPCAAPAVQVTNYDTADKAGVPDHYADGGYEGELIGELRWSATHSLHLTGNTDGQEPAVHIFQSRHGGNLEVSELRVLSRCSGPNNPNNWIRDAVDRVHSNDARAIAFSESGMAWAYNYGRSFGRNNFPDKMVVEDMMFVAHRETNACAP